MPVSNPSPGGAGGFDGSRIQAVRVNMGAITVGATADVTVTWPVPFADANYTVTATAQDNVGTTTAGTLTRKIISQTAAAVVIRVSDTSTAILDGQAFLHVHAIHD